MRIRPRLLRATLGAVIATALPAPSAAASFHLWRGSEFTFSLFKDRGSLTPFFAGNIGLPNPPQEHAIIPTAHRFIWNAPRPFGEFAFRDQANVRQFAEHVHLQRFRLLGINGTAPFPMAAFEFGTKGRFFGNHVTINAGVFRYRYGGYRLTLPGGRGYNGVAAVLPSLGMKSRTTGAELEAAYKLSSRDYVGVNASYAFARRSSLLVVTDPQITNAHSFQTVSSYEHILPLSQGRSLTFDAAAIYRSSVRVTNRLPGLVTDSSPTGGSDPLVRKIDGTRFDTSVTYRSGRRFSVTAFVRNITDVHPDRSTTLTTHNLVNPATVSTMLSEPRTLGLLLSARL